MVTKIGDMIPPMPATGAGSGSAVQGRDFSSFMKEAAQDAVGNLHKGEEMSKLGIAGEADLNDVVAAVNDAEMTLQTVTALRDKIVAAYQEIIRMPV